MTQGRPWKVLLTFAVPLILSAIIQHFYNLADSVIVGNYAGLHGGISGQNALAAVGASSTVTALFISLGSGGSIGCGVVISQLFGARRYADMKSTLYTSLLFFGAVALVLTAVGSVVATPLTGLMNTPEDIFAPATDYLRIYMFGLPFLFLYNVCNAIFNALGDSRKPLFFLIFSTLFNIALDYLFVAKCGWNVKGVAWATFIAQGVACLLSLFVLLYKVRGMETGGGTVRYFDNKKLLAMLRIGVPSMLQMSVVSVGALLVQAVVNTFGAAFIAGYSSAVKVHNFLATAIYTSGSAVSTFTAQNIGANRYDRVGEGIRAALVCMVSFCVVVAVTVFLFGENFIRLFMDSPSREALDAGVYYLRLICVGMIPFCFFSCFNGVARGAGYMPAFVVSTFSDLLVRVVFCYAFVSVLERRVVTISVLAGWSVGIIISTAFHLSGRWKHAKRL